MHLIRSAPALGNCFLTVRIGIGRHRSGDEWIRNLIGTKVIVWRTRAAATQVREVAGDHQIVGCAGPRLRDKVSLPITQDPGSRPALEPSLPFTEGWFI